MELIESTCHRNPLAVYKIVSLAKWSLFNVLFVFYLFTGINGSSYVTANDSPWGVAAHPLVNSEWPHRNKAVDLMKKAGITWVREDFKFSRIVQKSGDYDFSQYDEYLDLCDKAGIKVLPILQAYDWEIKGNHSAITPIYNHPQQWREFVRAVVSRYQDRIKCWEIWNEPDGGFWKPKPNAAQYVSLLKIAYEEIKQINPDLKVIVGGLCGWNHSYLNSMYENGAKGYFDIIAVHPYGKGIDSSKYMQQEMKAFKALLKKRGDSFIDIWITEAGSSTFTSKFVQNTPDGVIKAINLAMKKVGSSWPENKTPVIGGLVCLSAPNREFLTTRKWLPGAEIIPLTPQKLLSLSPKVCPVVIGCETIHVEKPYLVPLREYINKGGIVLAFGDIPFYNIVEQDKNGTWNSYASANTLHPFFRIGFKAWWNDKRIPKATQKLQVDNEFEDMKQGVIFGKASRYLTSSNIKTGDVFTPLLSAIDDRNKQVAPAMALYTFNDWKGAILANTVTVNSGYSEQQQADSLQTMFLSYISQGIKRIFIYDLHSDGQLCEEREDNFGLLRWNWTPKPAYNAYMQMTKALGRNPQFLKRINCNDKNVWPLVFKNMQTGENILVIWSIQDKPDISLLTEGKILKKLALTQRPQFIILKNTPPEYSLK